MSLCVGLTGGIASGKSTVARYFEELGVPLIDADQVARDVVRAGTPGLADVIACFGQEFLQPDGELDRRRLRELVFGDADKRRELEGLLHPRIKAALGDWRAALDAAYGILMAPIMTEGGFDAFTDRILVVDVSRATQKQRLVARDDISAELAEHMLNAQADRAARLAIADDVLDNSGRPEALPGKVAELHQKYLSLAATTP